LKCFAAKTMLCNSEDPVISTAPNFAGCFVVAEAPHRRRPPARPGHAELFWFFRADRCDAVFRDEQANPRRSVHERAAKSHTYRGFPHDDFAASGDWFWLKSADAHGFDVKAFDQNYVYIRSTELVWSDNTTFKRFVNDLPIAARCVPSDGPGPEIEVADTSFQYFSSCNP
jgi:hypothetical protein